MPERGQGPRRMPDVDGPQSVLNIGIDLETAVQERDRPRLSLADCPNPVGDRTLGRIEESGGEREWHSQTIRA